MENKQKLSNLVFLLSIILVFIPYCTSAQPTGKYVKEGLPDNYGICLIADGKVTGARTDAPFAMHSVMKFPQAIYVAEYLKKQKTSLHETVKVRKADLMQDTWSPMLMMFDNERQFSYAELLELSLSQSDNNACDILFRQFGGPKSVEEYLKKLGFNDIHIKWSEREMGVNPVCSADNNCSPKGMARLFEWFYQEKDQDEYLCFVWNTMANCKTGSSRLASIIPEGSVFVHKTGTGFPSKDMRQDRNDVGIIISPDGTYQIIAVFVPQSMREEDVSTIGEKYIMSSSSARKGN